MALNRTPPLEEKVEKLRAEIDAFIDQHVATIKKDCPGIPAPVIRQMATARAVGCQCSQYLILKNAEDEAAAKENAA